AGRHRDQLQHRQRRYRLAAAGLADHADGLAVRDGEIDAVDRMHPAVVAVEMGLQAPDLKQLAIRRDWASLHHSTFRGSSASRRPSPMKLMVITVRKIAPPANSAQCGAMSR